MGREEDSRGTTQIARSACHFVPTNIGFPDNAGIAVRTTQWDKLKLILHSRERLERELQLGSVECNFTNCLAHLWRLPSAYFPLSLPFGALIICGIILLSSGDR